MFYLSLTQFPLAEEEWNRYSVGADTLVQKTTSTTGSSSVRQPSTASTQSGVAHHDDSRSVSKSSKTSGSSKESGKTSNPSKEKRVDLDDYDSELEHLPEDYAVFDNPDILDPTSEDETNDREPSTPPRPRRDPTAPDSPSIAVVEMFQRNGVEQCRLANGRVVTRYEHLQLVTIGERNAHLRALGIIDDTPKEVAPKTPPPSLPANFVMPPRWQVPARAAAGRFASS